MKYLLCQNIIRAWIGNILIVHFQTRLWRRWYPRCILVGTIAITESLEVAWPPVSSSGAVVTVVVGHWLGEGVTDAGFAEFASALAVGEIAASLGVGERREQGC